MFTWLHFVPWHLLLWLSLPAGAAAIAWAIAPEAALAAAKAVPKRIWIAAAVIIAAALYHEAALTASQAGAAAETNAAWEAKFAAATKAAKADHDKLQAKIDAQAGPSNADLSKQFAKLQGTIDTMKVNEQVNYRPPKPLPPDCKLDAGRVAQLNAALAK